MNNFCCYVPKIKRRVLTKGKFRMLNNWPFGGHKLYINNNSGGDDLNMQYCKFTIKQNDNLYHINTVMKCRGAIIKNIYSED